MRMQSDNLNWFVGVVENRDDPLQQGRVQVRCAGVHPFSRIQGDIQGIPVEDLPWMSSVFPVTSANISSISSPLTGLLNGSSVFGIWLDQYKTNGLILGTYSGNQVNLPNFEEGFSDPNGQYPSNAGPDISGLNAGGAYGDQSSTNAEQDSNASTGVLVDGADSANEDNSPGMTIEQMLLKDEGSKLVVYWVDGLPHVGIGHLIVDRRTRDMTYINNILSSQVGRRVNGMITHDDQQRLFKQDLDKVRSEIRKNTLVASVYVKMNRSRQMALENMSFQMGTGGLAKFKTMLGFLAQGKYEEASKSARQSLWARQTPGRASKIAMILKNGNLASYGIRPPTKVGKLALMSTTSSFNSYFNGFDPDDPNDTEIEPNYDIPVSDTIGEDLSIPYVPENNGVLFVEPNSSYRGVYPYVKATKSEGGHVIEFDDTPGQERYRQMHPSGTYSELAADGRVTDKAVGDRYFLTNGTRCDLVDGEYKTNIGGKETYINFDDVEHTVNGSVKSKVTGNRSVEIDGDETLKITGSGTIEVGAGVKIIVKGNADITVNGNASTNVSGNYSMQVGGTYNVTSGAVTWTTPRFDVV